MEKCLLTRSCMQSRHGWSADQVNIHHSSAYKTCVNIYENYTEVFLAICEIQILTLFFFVIVFLVYSLT